MLFSSNPRPSYSFFLCAIKLIVERLVDGRNFRHPFSILLNHVISKTNFTKCIDMVCRLWQYGLWSFQTGYTKLERFLHKNQHTQRKLLNFENWTNGEPL